MSPGGRHIRIDPSKTQGCQSILESLSSIKAGFLGKSIMDWCFRKQGLIIMDWCFMCKSQEKRVSHRFLHCREASEMWSLIFCLFGVSLVMPSSVLELLSC